jgi:hypothetical protein
VGKEPNTSSISYGKDYSDGSFHGSVQSRQRKQLTIQTRNVRHELWQLFCYSLKRMLDMRLSEEWL